MFLIKELNMKQKIFYVDAPFFRNRPINVKIDEGCISFHFKRENNREFYSIFADHWDEQFKNHMTEKSWFTKEMLDFIEKMIVMV